ncbi:helix-turn-helix domain-containing protein [Micromonospora sp. WMMD882]|uniref:winged helix-turn-helix transcriptional regulator n=1 Tax=Micromonospora sp. WMMD882 TaxID=3015151 RepID=UPI00248BF619|nr:helix-turn-helix domain-containing protein [Micromonospora sp. WMMD882]WBB81219.1 helix-turn-helix domain-containing protein [Micromonospora sp. WMMD882]
MSEPLDPAMFADCPGAPSLVRIGDKWTGRIMVCLATGRRRFSELQAPLAGITPKVLTESLRAMERDGLVTRTAHPENPPRVEYALTPLGHELSRLMDTCCAWAAAHRDDLREARRAYARRSDQGSVA